MAKLSTLATVLTGVVTQLSEVNSAVVALKDSITDPEIPADVQAAADAVTAATNALVELVKPTA